MNKTYIALLVTLAATTTATQQSWAASPESAIANSTENTPEFTALENAPQPLPQGEEWHIQDLTPAIAPAAPSEIAQSDAQQEFEAASQTRDGFYGAVSGDLRYFNSVGADPFNAAIDFNTGYALNAALGYKFNNFRVEGQFAYGKNDLDQLTLTAVSGTLAPGTPLVTGAFTVPQPGVPLPGGGFVPGGTTIPAGIPLNPGNPPTTAAPVNVGGVAIPAGTALPTGIPTTGGTAATTIPSTTEVEVDANGSISTVSGLLNLYYDIPISAQFEPYIGAGIGFSNIAANDASVVLPGTASQTKISGNTTVLVYQLMAGIAYYVNPKVALTLGYRYFNFADNSVDFDVSGDFLNGKFTAEGGGVNNIEFGARFKF